ncbi:unnamed protein product [Cochlearia groenlandica]
MGSIHDQCNRIRMSYRSARTDTKEPKRTSLLKPILGCRICLLGPIRRGKGQYQQDVSVCWDRYTEEKPDKSNTSIQKRRYCVIPAFLYRSGYINHLPTPSVFRNHQILHKPTMGPKKASRANKGKGKVTGDEPPRRRTRSGSVVIREPIDEVPREEPRQSESRKRNARRRRDEPAVVEEEEYEYVRASDPEPEEEEAPRGFAFPPRTSETPLVRDTKKQPSLRELYDALMEITFVPSRFPDPDTLKKLGIYDEVKEILRNMRLDWVLGMKHNAYKEETCQYLATLQILHTEQGIRVMYSGNNRHTYGASLEIWERILGILADGKAELSNEPGKNTLPSWTCLIRLSS